jgi:hypothetical protein
LTQPPSGIREGSRFRRFRWTPLLLLAGLALDRAGALPQAPAARNDWARVTEDDSAIHLETDTLTARFRKKGYVSGVAAQSFLDRRTGFRDPGHGLDIADWIMQDGSDDAYEEQLPDDLRYRHTPEILRLIHGLRPKRKLEGPQICTQARVLDPHLVRGQDFVAVESRYTYTTAAPPYRPGSTWTQRLVFQPGKRYFVSMDRIDSVNDYAQAYLRIDMPGHIRRNEGDPFSEVYLSYQGGAGGAHLPASAFAGKFMPEEKFNYRRDRDGVPKRFIRAYRLRDPKSGAEGPWLAGMTLDPGGTHEAWCNNVGYVCFIQEVGPEGPVRAGGSFSTAFIVGYFDSVAEMHAVYDRHKGYRGVALDSAGWRLTR